jgi:hypothetical protein
MLRYRDHRQTKKGADLSAPFNRKMLFLTKRQLLLLALLQPVALTGLHL